MDFQEDFAAKYRRITHWATRTAGCKNLFFTQVH